MNGKNEIFEILKLQVVSKIDQISPENAQSISADVQKFLSIMNELADMNFVSAPASASTNENSKSSTGLSNDEPSLPDAQMLPNAEPESVQQAEQGQSSPQDVLEEHWTNDHRAYIGRFHLGLSGGHVGSIKISESKLHKMEDAPQNGDWVKAEELPSVEDDYARYKITTLKRDPLPTEIVRLRFLPAVFRKDVNRWYIEFKSPEHETTQQILLRDYDVATFKLKPGDYIDYAYRRGQEIEGKVVWKYSEADAITTRLKIKFSKSSEESDSSKSNQTSTPSKPQDTKVERQLLQVYAGKTILLVCMENSALPRKIKRNVEERGGTLTLSPHSDSNSMLKTKVEKADMVVVPTDFVGHEQMHVAKDEAKRLNKPIWMAKNTSDKNMVQWFRRHL